MAISAKTTSLYSNSSITTSTTNPVHCLEDFYVYATGAGGFQIINQFGWNYSYPSGVSGLFFVMTDNSSTGAFDRVGYGVQGFMYYSNTLILQTTPIASFVGGISLYVVGDSLYVNNTASVARNIYATALVFN